MGDYIITKEKPGHVVYKVVDPKTGEQWGLDSKSNKYLCIGGTFDGQFKAWVQLRVAKLDEHYDGFNFADYFPKNGRKKNPWSKIWVWSDNLIEP